MKLSIIIALYNNEKYIEKCIESIYKDTNLSCFEVIVVNDGSTDRSKEIIENLLKSYSNLRLINKENGGQSSARNVGFRLAKGDYLFCLDSDDYIDSDMLTLALSKAVEFNVDILAFDCVVENELGERKIDNKFNYVIEEIERGSIVDFCNKTSILGAMCFYLYKRSIVIDNNLYLHEGIKHEDEEFVTLFICYSQNISYYKLPVYNYRIHELSTTNSNDSSHKTKLLYDLISVIVVLKEHSNKDIFKSEIKNILNRKIQQLLVSVLYKAYSNGIELKEFSLILKKLKKEFIIPIEVVKGTVFSHRVICQFVNLISSKISTYD